MQIESVHGIGPALIRRIKERWPKLLDDADLRRNPYLLTSIFGIGFSLADRVALQAVGLPQASPVRIEAAGRHVLSEAEMSGHTCLPTAVFAQNLTDALGCQLPASAEFDEAHFVEMDGRISRRSMYVAETAVAARIREMVERPAAAFMEPNLTGLKDDQIAALSVMWNSNVFALMGGPGVGKTFLVKCAANGVRGKVALCAPTGKAAKRIEELSGMPAQTIHRLLGVNHDGPKTAHSQGFSFNYNRRDPLPHDYIIVDEASMVDVRLMADLCEALKPEARLLLVGDPFQLPAVGPGAILRDLTSSRAIPNVELTELKRQDPNLLIARNCKSIRFDRKVMLNNREDSDLFFIPAERAEEIQQTVVSLICDRLPAKYGYDPRREIVCITALREKGALSVKALNAALRARLNPEMAHNPLPMVGDRVIQKSNAYGLGVMNGDIGTVVAADLWELTVALDTPEREVTAERSEWNLDLAYALTTHRAQGSEWPAVVVPIHEEQGMMVPNANHLYTTISRGKSHCVIVGSKRKLEQVAAAHREVARNTRLAALLV